MDSGDIEVSLAVALLDRLRARHAASPQDCRLEDAGLAVDEALELLRDVLANPRAYEGVVECEVRLLSHAAG